MNPQRARVRSPLCCPIGRVSDDRTPVDRRVSRRSDGTWRWRSRYGAASERALHGPEDEHDACRGVNECGKRRVPRTGGVRASVTTLGVALRVDAGSNQVLDGALRHQLNAVEQLLRPRSRPE